MSQPNLDPRDPSNTTTPYASHPSSILWAHQLRRDIVVLTELIKELQNDHATTTKILTDLGETVDLLLARIRTLELQRDTDKLILAQQDTKLEELADLHTEQLAKYKTMFDDIRATLEKAESANKMLLGKVEILERSTCVLQENTASEQVASAGTSRLGTASENAVSGPIRPGRIPARTAPENPSLTWIAPKQLQRTETATTWETSLSDITQPLARRRGSRFDLQLQLPNQALDIDSAMGNARTEAQILRSILQGGRSLIAYLEYANALRAEAPQVSDARFIHAFLLGHDEVAECRRAEEMAKEVGFSWESLAGMIRSHLEPGQGQVVGRREERRTGNPDGVGKISAANPPAFVENNNMRGRRTIPIVRPDTAESIYEPFAGRHD
ncbi:hypothetical protein BJX68DRAFT_89702 [Aspergillus pseudodeflectus]|uniref:Uncharacterized protein n=1 Tax=Aspergillus pseudodeflectus TaxID=176178 RepID=A0ABR4LB15_9EURO